MSLPTFFYDFTKTDTILAFVVATLLYYYQELLIPHYITSQGKYYGAIWFAACFVVIFLALKNMLGI